MELGLVLDPTLLFGLTMIFAIETCSRVYRLATDVGSFAAIADRLDGGYGRG
jgi:hypothetical protein